MNRLIKILFFLSVLAFVLAGIGVGLSYGPQSFYLLLLGILLGIITFFTSVFSLLLALFQKKSMKGSFALLYGFLLVLGLLYFYSTQMKGKPLINDITTDPKNPPQFNRSVKKYEPSFYEQQKRGYPEINAQVYPISVDRLYKASILAAQEMPNWDIIFTDKEAFHFEAIEKSSLFRFVDDISIDIRPLGDGKSICHIRSKSRLGRSDFGSNAHRILKFYKKLENVYFQLQREEKP